MLTLLTVLSHCSLSLCSPVSVLSQCCLDFQIEGCNRSFLLLSAALGNGAARSMPVGVGHEDLPVNRGISIFIWLHSACSLWLLTVLLLSFSLCFSCLSHCVSPVVLTVLKSHAQHCLCSRYRQAISSVCLDGSIRTHDGRARASVVVLLRRGRLHDSKHHQGNRNPVQSLRQQLCLSAAVFLC